MAHKHADHKDSPVRAYVLNSTGVLELNRPKALNSLNHEMVDIIDQALSEWETDDSIHRVVIYTESNKGFCAGGDVRAAREHILAGEEERADAYFVEEYAMNNRIATFPKPYVALIDGVVMGGGLGVSVHGSHRVISERAFGAMPEMAIGYIPDVGVPFVLQRVGQASLALANFVVLTGWRLSAADLLWTGIATDVVHSEHMQLFREMLIAEDIDDALERYGTELEEESELAKWAEDIEVTFAGPSFAEIEQAVAQHPNEKFRELVAQHFATASPSALVAAAELMAASAKCTTVRQELDLEITLGEYVRRLPDFVEGVRAVLVDKDRQPNFPPAVDVAEVRAALRQ
ncbi:3-hydroxyisobutyryl-CoA hydrolase [Corynebacterium sp. 35RC1]|nr:3-hydroxyisobutyryl-CoA hydrolase [Corynebacterium sp. 35RC1]